MCKKSSLAVIVAAALSAMMLSCTKNPDPKTDISLEAEVASQDFTQISVAFEPGADVKTVKCAYGSIFSQYKDSLAFASGTLTNIQTIDATKGVYSFSPKEGETVIVYLRPIAADGSKGEVICLQAVASPVDFEISNLSLGSFVYTVSSEATDYEGISLLAMAATAPNDWCSTAEEIVASYLDWGLLLPTAPGDSDMVELNGDPDYAQILGVVFWNKDYTYTIKTYNFTTSSVIPDAPEASIDVKVTNITSESADLEFSNLVNTCGYFYKLYTKEDYEATRQEGQKFGEDPDVHVRDQVAAGGSMNYKENVDKRTGLADKTEYVLVCYPFNVNGSKGWGAGKIINFTTPAAE